MGNKGKILIVDDDPDFLKTTKLIIESDGYEVVTASDGKQGLGVVKQSKPDLVLLDVMMETLFEGFSFLGTLRTDPGFADYSTTPILMISSVRQDTGSRFSFSDEEDMGDVPQPDDYMDKPLKPKELLEKLAAMIRKSS